MAFQPLPGFRDFYPEEMALRRHVERAWHAASRAAGFEEIEGPPLESLDLFRAKSGGEIVEQIYAFTDKGGREVALRAELTPTLARMAGARAAALKKPVKWYATPQLFRYERQQKGRLREHIQWNVDILGAPEVAAEAELLSVALDALRRLGLTEKDVYVRANHRRLAEAKLRELGVTDFERALVAIDRDQVEDPRVRAWLDEPFEADAEFDAFLAACDDYGIGAYVEPDKKIVRGLAYYTGIVFEIFDRERTLRAVAGGGRYDQLVEKLGGPAMPALGFGMGDVVLTELIRERGLLPPHPPRIDAMVVPIGEEMSGPARQVARRLRAAGLRAETPFVAERPGKAIKAAVGAGARRVYLVGPDEWRDGAVKVKELATGDERTVKVGALP